MLLHLVLMMLLVNLLLRTPVAGRLTLQPLQAGLQVPVQRLVLLQLAAQAQVVVVVGVHLLLQRVNVLLALAAALLRAQLQPEERGQSSFSLAPVSSVKVCQSELARVQSSSKSVFPHGTGNSTRKSQDLKFRYVSTSLFHSKYHAI